MKFVVKFDDGTYYTNLAFNGKAVMRVDYIGYAKVFNSPEEREFKDLCKAIGLGYADGMEAETVVIEG